MFGKWVKRQPHRLPKHGTSARAMLDHLAGCPGHMANWSELLYAYESHLNSTRGLLGRRHIKTYYNKTNVLHLLNRYTTRPVRGINVLDLIGQTVWRP